VLLDDNIYQEEGRHSQMMKTLSLGGRPHIPLPGLR
jgi:hypothetical protein